MLLFALLLWSFCMALPEKRWSHSTVIVKNKLYIFGGKTGTTASLKSPYSKEFLSLDLSSKFSSSNPPYKSVSSSNPPLIAQHSAAPTKDGFLVYGGTTENLADPLAYFYNIDQNAWTPGNDASFPSPRRYKLSSAYNEAKPDTSYFYGGVADGSSVADFNGTKVFDELYSFGVNNREFTKVVASDSPGPRYQHASVMLPSGEVVIIGGATDNDLASMKEVYVYSPSTSSWTMRVTGGQIPSDRRDFCAVGTLLS
jgi:N-acetylneuraminic acid mutarotase